MAYATPANWVTWDDVNSKPVGNMSNVRCLLLCEVGMQNAWYLAFALRMYATYMTASGSIVSYCFDVRRRKQIIKNGIIREL